jgi:hypothetical protein
MHLGEKSVAWDVLLNRPVLIPEDISWDELDRVELRDHPHIELVRRPNSVIQPDATPIILRAGAYWIGGNGRKIILSAKPAC